MDEKTLQTLEYPRILERLGAYASFSASAALVQALRPSAVLDEVQQLQARTSEARRLLSVNDTITIGGAHDVRPQVSIAARGGVLEAAELLDIKATLISSRELARSLSRQGQTYPTLARIAEALPPPPGVVEAIGRVLSERGEVQDNASDKLSTIRREIKIAHERLMSRLERLVNDSRNAPILQESIITQRNGRYVIPLRAEFKGRIKSIVHDQSASGATLFVEPIAVVELNNHWHELQLAERDEVRRILAELSGQVGEHAQSITYLVEALAELDLALACAKYADDLHAAEPLFQPIHPRKDHHPGTTIKLYAARHPLLDSASVVPIDVDLDENTFCLVITGPNTGGKTVTLKTVGLMALMAQSGLHIPAQSGSALSLFEDIYADIGDEQSIEQSLSTFSGHITNIVRILRKAGSKTLVLLDELGAGTDPQEGAALARSLLAHLLRRRITCLVATHYPELKAFAHNTPGVINASMEFNLRTLRPTYHLTVGLPGRSNALLIAERLGLPAEIITDARGTLNPDDLRAEDLLDEIHRQRDIARKARGKADRALYEAEKMRSELAARLEKMEDERRGLLEQSRQQAAAQVAALNAELEEVRRALLKARQPVEALKTLQEQVDDLETTVETPVERRAVTRSNSPSRPLKLGDKVRVRSLSMEGLITSLAEEEAEVQVGNLRVRARLSDIQRGGEPTPPAQAVGPKPRAQRTPPPAEETSRLSVMHPSPGMELDLRGQRAEDALEALERYIEAAYLADLPFVRIIHGKGTGRLRQVIRQALQSSAHVSRFESGHENEGGEGVTVANLKKG